MQEYNILQYCCTCVDNYFSLDNIYLNMISVKMNLYFKHIYYYLEPQFVVSFRLRPNCLTGDEYAENSLLQSCSSLKIGGYIVF